MGNKSYSHVILADGLRIQDPEQDMFIRVDETSTAYDGKAMTIASKQNVHIIIDTDNNDANEGGFTIRSGADTIDSSTELFKVTPAGEVTVANDLTVSGDLIAKTHQILPLGHDHQISGTTDHILEVFGSATPYRMPVAGYVTDLSCQFDVKNGQGTESLILELYKNGTATGKTVSVVCDSTGFTGVHGTITAESFAAGDTLTLAVRHDGTNLTTEGHIALLRILT